MTLGEAVEPYDQHACACSGPPPGETRCYCQIVYDEVHNLRRAAHILAKQLAEYAARRTPA